VIAELARRLSGTLGPTAKASTAIRTLAVIAAGGSRPSHRFVDSLRERAVFLSEREVTAHFAGRRHR
jgi:hypothetical protein